MVPWCQTFLRRNYSKFLSSVAEPARFGGSGSNIILATPLTAPAPTENDGLGRLRKESNLFCYKKNE